MLCQNPKSLCSIQVISVAHNKRAIQKLSGRTKCISSSPWLDSQFVIVALQSIKNRNSFNKLTQMFFVRLYCLLACYKYYFCKACRHRLLQRVIYKSFSITYLGESFYLPAKSP